VAPVGDLFESLIKRDLDVKDSGRVFGAHGGVLDRLDAVFFTVVVAYYAAVALGYG
jgi:phosphatidate cytidylyltransferase